ncbi:copper resistance protein CopC [Xylophilus sp. Kf1]|nr:copper resistance protein CopC [Xylophilus sp. Kf1]
MRSINTAALAALLTATAALAQPRLVSTVPAEGTEAASPAAPVELHFDQALLVRSSAARLVMTGMPGMSGHAPMPMAVTVSAGEDGRTMRIVPRQPLPSGTYRVDWRAVAQDDRAGTGTVAFTVK